MVMGHQWRHVLTSLLITGAVVVVCEGSSPVRYQPEQIHLAYGENATQMVVTWVTQDNTKTSAVEYGMPGNLSHVVQAQITKFINHGKFLLYRTMWIHRATMEGLEPGFRYAYHVGSAFGWSDLFFFQAKRDDPSWGPRLLVYGDLGNANAQSVPYIQREAQKGNIDAVLHIGDFAYDMDDNLGRVGDAFMRQIEPVAAYVPYMTLPGNHEQLYNFTQYKNRFSMPGSYESMMYSMVLGPAHIIMFNSEVFYKDESPDQTVMYTQYHWLEQRLQYANSPAVRAGTPWLIVMAHRPMYCSNADDQTGHCNNPNNPVRVGLNNVTREYSLEDLFYKYGVDMHFYAHEHSYERLWPVYKSQVCNGTEAPYTNPTGPVHIITGSAGDREGQTKFNLIPWPYSAFHTDDYGFTRLHVANSTHIFLEQVSTDKGGVVVDEMVLIKKKHGAGMHSCHLAV